MLQMKTVTGHPVAIWVARIVSLILHPIWLPMIFAAWKSWGDPSILKLLVLVAVFLITFPGLAALLWLRARAESDWFAVSQGNRIVPLLAGLGGMVLFAVANGRLLPARMFQWELVSVMALLLLIGFLVTLFWKISIHLLGWGAVDVFAGESAIHEDQWFSFATAVVLTAVVAWARWQVRSHDWHQIWAGWGAGGLAAILVLATF
jgi:hypothetical protein